MALLSAYALYVAGINLFLSTSLFERAFAGARDDLAIDYRRSWSIWPGTIHARGLEIRGQDSNVEWQLALDEVVFDVSFGALASHRFEVPRIHGRGVTFRLRRTLDARPTSLDEIADLPPIPGRGAYAISPAGPPSLERWFDEHYHLWTVRLEHVRADDVREIWVDQGHFEGHATIVGRFYLRPVRGFDVGPTTVTIDRGRVLQGARRPLLDDLTGTATITIDRNDPRALTGSDILGYLSLATDLRGRSADLENVPRLSANGFASSGVVAIDALALHVDHGVVADAHVVLGASRLVTARENLRLVAGAELVADVAHATLTSRLTARDARLERADGATIATASSLTATATGHALDLAHDPLRDLEAAIELPVDVADTRRLDALVPTSAPVRAGPGALHATLRATWSRPTDRVSALARVRGDVQAGVGTHAVSANGLLVEATIADAPAEDPLATLDLRTVVARAAVDGIRGGGAFEARLRDRDIVEKASFDVHDIAIPDALDVARVQGTAAGIALAAPLASSHAEARIENARVHGLRRWLPADTAWDIEAGRVDADVRLTFADRVARGALHATGRDVGIASDRGSVHANADVALALGGWAVDPGTLALGPSSVVLTAIRGRAPGSAADDLTARRIVLTGAARALRLGDPEAHGVDARLAIEDVAVPDAHRLDALLPRTGALHIDGGAARASGTLRLATTAAHATGTFSVALDRAGVTVGTTKLTGDVMVEAKLQGFDDRRKALDLAGSRITMKNVTAGTARQWDGLLVAKSAALRVSEDGPDLDALVWLEADDAKPLLGVLVAGSTLPKLVSGLVTMPRLRGRARLHFGPHVLRVSEVEATGGDVALRGAYGIYDHTKEGAFVVEKGAISVGLGLDDDGAHPRFFGLDRWLRERLDADAEKAAKKSVSGR